MGASRMMHSRYISFDKHKKYLETVFVGKIYRRSRGQRFLNRFAICLTDIDIIKTSDGYKFLMFVAESLQRKIKKTEILYEITSAILFTRS